MYIRMKSDNSGRLYLQQLLSLSDHPNGRGQPKWENVPTLGTEGIEARALPLFQSCGVFCFDVEETYPKADHTYGVRRAMHFVSALDVQEFYEESNDRKAWLKIVCRDKRRFNINMDRIAFCFLLTDLLTNFKVMKFDINGDLIQGEEDGKK